MKKNLELMPTFLDNEFFILEWLFVTDHIPLVRLLRVRGNHGNRSRRKTHSPFPSQLSFVGCFEESRIRTIS